MEDKVLRLMSYLALLAVVVWIVASALGRRDQLNPPKQRCNRAPDSNVWARLSVPAPVSGWVAPVVPIPPQ